MGIFGRIGNLLKGKADRAVEKAEKGDSDAIFRSAIAEKEKDIKELTQMAREAKGLEMSEEQQITACKDKLDVLNMDLEAAVDVEDEALGAQLIEQIEEINAEIDINEAEKAEYNDQFNTINASLEEAKSELATLKKEHQEAAHLEKSHKIMQDIEDRKTGISNSSTSKALENARNRINTVKASSAAMSETKAASLESKRKELREKAAAGKNTAKFQEMLSKKNKKSTKK